MICQNTMGLILKEVSVPPFIVAGDKAVMGCNYDTQGDLVYSVKWYKGGLEIFRYLPSFKDQPITTFPRSGVIIDESESNSSSITMINTSLASTGRYRCEVSTEAPMFSTESKFGDLLVLVLPATPPVIMGGELEYSIGDFLHLNCSSFESKPAADLSWFINDKKADKSYIIPHPIGFNKQTGLYTSKSELFMTLGQVHFTEEGKLNVRCEATIGNEKNLTDSSIKQKKR